MGQVPLVTTVIEWYCPNCKATDQTRTYGAPAQRFHTCPKLRYMSAPMIEQGKRAKVVLNEREDYIGDEIQRRDPERGRPVMNITKERDDGATDVWAFAPLAVGRLER